MKRSLWAVLLLAGGLSLYAQESGAAQTTEATAKASHQIYWLWANFVILIVALGYLTRKYAPEFFRSRAEQIRKGIDEAAKLKKEAEERAAEMDRRMSALESEIEKLRRDAHAEIQAEGERVRVETGELLAKIRRQNEQEIAALSSHARQNLRVYAAQLATDLAAERIRARMTPAAQDGLVANFVAGLEKEGSRN